MPNEVQEGMNLGILPGGAYDSVQSLYIDNTPSIFKGYSDPYNLIVNGDAKTKSYTSDLRMLVPEGFRDAFSFDTKTNGRLCIRSQFNSTKSCNHIFRANIRAMVTKMPGFFFMSYR